MTRIDADEWYPVYSVVDEDRTYGHEVDATPEQIARWQAATDVFKAAQEEIGDLYREAEQRDRAERAKAKAEKEAAEKAERKRVEAERRAAMQEQQQRRDAMWQHISNSGGDVYDSDGNRIGTVRPTGLGVSTGVTIDPA